MPGEPPDPLDIAKHLRILRDQTNDQRLLIAQLVNANPDKASYATAYRQASASIDALTASADALDPPQAK